MDPFLVFLSIKGVEKYMYWIASRKIKRGPLTEKFENQCPAASLQAHMSVPRDVSPVFLAPHSKQARCVSSDVDSQPLDSIRPPANHTRLQDLPPALPVTGHHGTPPAATLEELWY